MLTFHNGVHGQNAVQLAMKEQKQGFVNVLMAFVETRVVTEIQDRNKAVICCHAHSGLNGQTGVIAQKSAVEEFDLILEFV